VDETSEILLEAQAGSEIAFAAFVHRTQAEIWRLCGHLVGKAHADDATQETYLAAWRALASFRGDSSARTWLFVIARRTALRFARRQLSLTQLDRKASAPADPPDPERCAELGGLVDHLDEDRRLALILTQVFGLSYAETAEVCGCAVGTIRSRVARTREQLLASWSDSRRATGDMRQAGGAVGREETAGAEAE